MAKILFLDDDDLRHELFQEWHGGEHTVIHAHTWAEFVKALDEHTFDWMSLDHDLNDNWPKYMSVAKSGRGYDGRDAAAYVSTLPLDKRPVAVTIHSWNDLGAMAMWDILNMVGIPAKTQMFSLEAFNKRLAEWYKAGKPHPFHRLWFGTPIEPNRPAFVHNEKGEPADDDE